MNIETIRKQIIGLVKKILPDLPSDFQFELEIPPEAKMGDISLACFKITEFLKKSPEKISDDLALEIKKLLKKRDDPKGNYLIEKVKSIGPYLNFFLNKKIWFDAVCQEVLTKKDTFGNLNIGQGKRILVEYSAPNTNKPQHLGHLRNNFLGWSVVNLLATVGFRVIKANMVNDRGIHICKSMLAYQKWGQGTTPESEKMKGDHFVGRYYVLFEKKAEENPELLVEGQKMLEKWEAGDSQILSLWRKMNKWAMDGFKKTYQKIGIDFDKWYFESDTYKLGKKIILKALKKGLCEKREDGAIEIDLIKDGLDKKVLIRADGTSVYVTQDIGLAKLKQSDFRPNKSIYVVASEQDYHFKVLFKILKIFGFAWSKNCYHLSYGMVFLPKGKMKSREGTVVEADEIIAKMEQLAKSEILARDSNLSPTEVSRRAEIIALAALKFFFLKFTPAQQIHFKPEESISFEGATGPYIQYTYARIQSILKKADLKGISQKEKVNYGTLGKPAELILLKLLFVFPETLVQSADAYNPTYLANYLLKLSQKFNEFYHKIPVLKARPAQRLARLALIKAVAEVVKRGLGLLGIETLDKM